MEREEERDRQTGGQMNRFKDRKTDMRDRETDRKV